MASSRDGAVLGSIRSAFDVGTSAGMDDAQLLDRFLSARDEVAEASFETLVIRHGPMVLGVCRDTLRDADAAQDAFQATFLVLARRAGSIRRQDALAGWLYGVARKVATRARCDAARRRVREREAGSVPRAEPGPRPEPDDIAALYEEIDRLPGAYREPVVLCDLDGMTYEAAARHLGCPLGTLSVRLKRARERLRERLTRRGLDVPAGFAVAGHGAGSTALPTALANLAARSAMGWKSGLAIAPGMVPAAVASLAKRTITMMRLKTFGVGVLALGGVTLAASASLAVIKNAATPPDAPGVQASPKPARSWVKTLPGGATVELVGVSPYPATPATWRAPEGGPLPAAPYARSGFGIYPGEGQRAWEFAVRFANLPEGNESRRWEIVPSAGSATGNPRDAENASVPGLGSAAVCLPTDRRTCTIRAGVAYGPWKTEVANAPEQIALGREKMSVIFGRPREEGGRTAVTISHDDSEDDVRVVAADALGKEYFPTRTVSQGVRNYRQLEVQYDLPIASIREFRLQTRPYAWAEFADVPLAPQGK